MQDSKSHYYWAIVGIAALAVLGLVLILNNNLAKDSSVLQKSVVSQNGEGKARLLIDFGNGKKRTFRGAVVGGMTVYDVLLASKEVGSFSFSVNGNGIEEIDGVKNNPLNSHEWRYSVNGKASDVSPEFEEVKPGDEIVFKFE